MGINVATTINATSQPPLAGNVVLAAGTNVTLTQTGNQISIAATGGGPGGSVNKGTTTANFGTGGTDVKVTVTGQTSILTTNVVNAWALPSATASNTADDTAYDDIEVVAYNIVNGTGFDILVKSGTGLLHGIHNIAWTWS